MTRYQALRRLGCDPLSAAFIAVLNWMRGVEPNRIVFMTLDVVFGDMDCQSDDDDLLQGQGYVGELPQ